MKGDCATALALARVSRPDETGPPLQEPYRSLFEGAAAACLAAFHGRADLWPTAMSRLASIKPSRFACWDREVYTILAALVRAHRDNPDAKLVRGQGRAGCPEIEALIPDHGPRAGGYPVQVTGRNLPPTLDLAWYDQTVTARRVRGSGGRMTLVVPAARSGQVSNFIVSIVGAYRIEGVMVNFRFDDCGDVCP
jgi:hypothetical protein